MQFLFSPSDTVDLSTGTFYAHIVNVIPNESSTTVAALNISNAIGYTPYTLSELVYTSKLWTFSDFTFPAYTYNTAPVGLVVCKQLGTNISNSDPILYYGDFLNILSQNISINTGKYTIFIKFPINGIIEFKQYYEYSSSAYVNTETIPKGLMYLLGTRNNTQSFLSPYGNAVLDINSESSIDPFNRIIDNLTISDYLFAFNFGSRRIQVGTWAHYSRDTSTARWTIWGSNTYLSGALNSTSDWIPLGTSTSTVAGWNFITCNNSTYWKHLKFTADTNFNQGLIQEMEFYNSSMYSTDPDLMSTIIDSPFNNDILDNTGFNHTWTSTGSGTIQNNSLYLPGASSLTLNTSSLFNLTTRNFKLSLDFKWISQDSSTSPGIINWDGAHFPLVLNVYNNNYSHAIGTSTVWFYLPNSNGILSAPSITTYDIFKTTRVGNNFTTNLNSNTYTGISGGTVGNSGTITLGLNSTSSITGNIRNLKLIT